MSVVKCSEGHRHNVTIDPGARKRPVGSAREAIAAREGQLQFLGAGVAKDAYVSRDGRRVYKVPNNEAYCSTHDDCDCEPTLDEWQIAEEFSVANGHYRDRRRPAYVAPTSAFVIDGVTVLCQPRYQPVGELFDNGVIDYEQKERYMRIAYEAERRIGIGDMHSDNCGVTANGRVVLFDLGA